MRVPGLVLSNEKLLQKMKTDRTLGQCANVTHLPGIYKHALTLPDGHEGYGFPIGGVAATDYEEGVISPGGVGYDINCGVRLLTTNFSEEDVQPKLKALTGIIFKYVPCGLGSRRKDFRTSVHELDRVISEGVPRIVEQGYGRPEDVDHCEEKGHMELADPDRVSGTAKKRGLTQIGTLGSGNHFLEVQKVDKIYNPEVAKAFGIQREGQVTAMIHCGSRGFGHQVCSDYLRVAERAIHKYEISLPDRELACAPGQSAEGQDYFKAMSCAVNYAFSNRQMITHWVRQSFEEAFKTPAEEKGLGSQERCNQSLPAGTPSSSTGLPKHRSACPDTGLNGDKLLCARRRSHGNGSVLRLNRPRSWKNDEPICREEKVLGCRRKEEAGEPWNRHQIC
jgi:tRNA-splicing ligase RtcB